MLQFTVSVSHLRYVSLMNMRQTMKAKDECVKRAIPLNWVYYIVPEQNREGPLSRSQPRATYHGKEQSKDREDIQLIWSNLMQDLHVVANYLKQTYALRIPQTHGDISKKADRSEGMDDAQKLNLLVSMPEFGKRLRRMQRSSSFSLPAWRFKLGGLLSQRRPG
ncbi:hypothetical protein ARMGADRAFT_1034374 [Armillaria gallica]|uniref:Uncharacterized protein n=1 Tax=Armillaria gallica TaxID=47427 RepID=A0A2H3D9K3_ARMGA|nr:hypothetical protein ARMGADRAFT_1034374 [Armillaria gallica]